MERRILIFILVLACTYAGKGETSCEDGSEPINCIVSPCENATCDPYPDATCTDNNCGGCNADWYVDGEPVDCEDCSNIQCDLPVCPFGSKIVQPEDSCCPVCGEVDCSTVVCALPVCPAGSKIIQREDSCCPICGEVDCINVICAVPECPVGTDIVTPEGSCCPVCGGVDCRTVPCALPICPLGFKIVYPEDSCCPVCGEVDCSAVLCPLPECQPGSKIVHPEGSCCPVCGEVDCSAVLCARPDCPESEFIQPEGTCCPLCRDDVCSLPIKRGKGKDSVRSWGYRKGRCRKFDYKGSRGNENRFKSKKDCQAACEQKDCSTVRCALPECPIGSQIVQPEDSCCPLCGEIDCSTVRCARPNCPETLIIHPEGSCCPLCRDEVCNLPIKRGKGKDSIKSWGYLKGRCRKFEYKGSRGNANRFKSSKDCQAACEQEESIDCSAVRCARPNCTESDFIQPEGSCCPLCRDEVCKLRIKSGKGKDSIFSWGYQKGRCKKFEYKGSRGNANRFKSRKDCQTACERKDDSGCKDGSEPVNCLTSPCQNARCDAYPKAKCRDNYCGGCNADWYVNGKLVDCDVCKLRIKKGKGKDSILSWGYRKGRCRKFEYKGSRGNANRFKSKEDCQAACEQEDVDCQTVRCAPPNCPETEFIRSEGSCCPVCREEVCKLPIVPGPCRASIPRWGYNNGHCQEFTYGGCQGNDNRFLTQADCMAACEQRGCSNVACARPNCLESEFIQPEDGCCPVCRDEVCNLPLDPGPCDGVFNTWGYSNGHCQEFTYGGCEGNYNRFTSEAECVAACGQNVCQLPLVAGPCEALINRWGFQKGECVGFIYGGCDGNANNFESLAECIDECGPNTSQNLIQK